MPVALRRHRVREHVAIPDEDVERQLPPRPEHQEMPSILVGAALLGGRVTDHRIVGRVRSRTLLDRHARIRRARSATGHAAGESSAGLAGSGRGRRHSRRRDRSASQCGVSCGRRACRVRVPVILIRLRRRRIQYSRSPRSSGTRADIPAGSVRASARSGHCPAASPHSLWQR